MNKASYGVEVPIVCLTDNKITEPKVMTAFTLEGLLAKKPETSMIPEGDAYE